MNDAERTALEDATMDVEHILGEHMPGASASANFETGCIEVDLILTGASLPMLIQVWREGDLFILRSSEFDVMAEDEDFGQALDKFVTWLSDYADHLAELVRAKTATSDERETLALLRRVRRRARRRAAP